MMAQNNHNFVIERNSINHFYNSALKVALNIVKTAYLFNRSNIDLSIIKNTFNALYSSMMNYSKNYNAITNHKVNKDLVDQTLKFFEVFYEDNLETERINKLNISKDELQKIIKNKDSNLEAKLQKLGFDSYGDLLIEGEKNIRNLGIKTENQDYIVYSDYGNIKNQLEEIVKNGYSKEIKEDIIDKNIVQKLSGIFDESKENHEFKSSHVDNLESGMSTERNRSKGI
jgi:hypothetical protein